MRKYLFLAVCRRASLTDSSIDAGSLNYQDTVSLKETHKGGSYFNKEKTGLIKILLTGSLQFLFVKSEAIHSYIYIKLLLETSYVLY